MAAHRRLAHRLDGIPPTIFTAMSALAVRTQSVNLGQGFPDVDGPPEVVAQAVHALETGQNQYALGPGVPALRQAVARHQLRHYGLEARLRQPGRRHDRAAPRPSPPRCSAWSTRATRWSSPSPTTTSYTAMIQMAGGVRRPVTLRAPGIGDEHSRLDVDEAPGSGHAAHPVRAAQLPHNPTGTVLTPGELQAVADVALEHDLVVITDEVYEHLVFDGSEHVPIATLPGMFERTLTLSSVGKSYSFTGWKVGWATGPADLVGAVLAAKQWLTFTSGSPLQPAVAHALDEQADYLARLAADLQAKRDLLCGGLAGIGLDVRVPEGTHFATTDISALGWPGQHGLLPGAAGTRRRRRRTTGGVLRPDAGRHLVRWAFKEARSSRKDWAGWRPPTWPAPEPGADVGPHQQHDRHRAGDEREHEQERAGDGADQRQRGGRRGGDHQHDARPLHAAVDQDAEHHGREAPEHDGADHGVGDPDQEPSETPCWASSGFWRCTLVEQRVGLEREGGARSGPSRAPTARWTPTSARRRPRPRRAAGAAARPVREGRFYGARGAPRARAGRAAARAGARAAARTGSDPRPASGPSSRPWWRPWGRPSWVPAG